MKKVLSSLLALMIVLGMGITAFAGAPNNPSLPRVVDKADVLSVEEEQELESLASQIQEKYDVDFVIYTDSSSNGKSDEQGAEDFYDENGYGVGEDASGSICYICLEPGNRFVYTSACGKSIYYFTYDSINIIDDATVGYYADGNFYQGLVVYADYVDELYKNGSLYSSSGEIINREERPVKNDWMDVLPGAGIISLMLGFGIAFTARKKAKDSMISVANATKAEEYKVRGSFNLSRSENIFLTMTVSRVPRVQNENNSHSGGSSFSGPHISSGGSTHSGGGRSF